MDKSGAHRLGIWIPGLPLIMIGISKNNISNLLSKTVISRLLFRPVILKKLWPLLRQTLLFLKHKKISKNKVSTKSNNKLNTLLKFLKNLFNKKSNMWLMSLNSKSLLSQLISSQKLLWKQSTLQKRKELGKVSRKRSTKKFKVLKMSKTL